MVSVMSLATQVIAFENIFQQFFQQGGQQQQQGQGKGQQQQQGQGQQQQQTGKFGGFGGAKNGRGRRDVLARLS